MRYKAFKDGIELSTLGMGNMRLPTTEAEGRPIDYDRAKEIIDAAIAGGVNYFDTAYIYHGGESEKFLAKALKDYPRDSYYLADKYNIQAQPDFTLQFPEQLERLSTDRIDFYLLHGIDDGNVDKFLSNGCIEYFERKKAEGAIRYLGFSFHGSPATLRRAIAVRDWDFVQIQLNYYDWATGTAKEQYEILAEAGIPIMVMEPVHGGMLAKLNENCAARLEAKFPGKSLASAAMRWVMSLPAVQVVLSGMSTAEQLRDNLATFSSDEPLDEGEREFCEEIAREYKKDVSVPCTACRYCTDGCPAGLEIPSLLASYNEMKVGGTWRIFYMRDLAPEKQPSACIGCGACTATCPQSIDVPKFMQEMADILAK